VPTWNTSITDTIDSIFDDALNDCPDALYLDFSGERYTYADVGELIARTANVFRDLGVKPGDRVLTLLDNNVDAVATLFAANRIGAIAVPVNTAYRGEFLRHQVADSGAEVVVAEAHYVERLTQVRAGTSSVRSILRRAGESASDGFVAPFSAGGGEFQSLEGLLAQADNKLQAPVARMSDLSCLIYTAGTTGPSKGCMVSHNYALNVARMYLEVTGRQAHNHTWTPLPLFHFNAWTCSVFTTAMLRSSASISPRFSLSGFWPEIERSAASMTTLLGTMISLIANAPDSEAAERCRGQLDIVQGAPFPAELIDTWRERFGVGWAGANVFGLTECCLTTHLPRGEADRPGSSGRRNSDFDVRIFDDNDRELDAGQVGEIVVRPLKPHVMFEGYWNRPDATAALMRNLWFHTGDLGMFDEDGFFHFKDRKKDYLRRRGENISSFEMESAFQLHPDINDVAVHSVFSDLTEDDVKVTAVLREGAELTEQDLCIWSFDHLPYFAIPRYIEFRSELPKNPVGRVLKYVLRDEGRTEGTWDREKAGIEMPKR
jgi:crotonobetaine/carnitine-CoA ligase